jgi:hypothetical protein
MSLIDHQNDVNPDKGESGNGAVREPMGQPHTRKAPGIRLVTRNRAARRSRMARARGTPCVPSRRDSGNADSRAPKNDDDEATFYATHGPLNAHEARAVDNTVERREGVRRRIASARAELADLKNAQTMVERRCKRTTARPRRRAHRAVRRLVAKSPGDAKAPPGTPPHPWPADGHLRTGGVA